MDGQQVIDRDLADEIVIESGTETPEQLQASLAAGGVTVEDDPPPAEAGEPPVETPPAEPTPAAAAAATAPAADTRSEFERKVDEIEPPPSDETSEQRTVRMARGEKRILGLLSRSKAAEDRAAAAEAEVARLKAAPAEQPPAPAAGQPPKSDVAPFTFQTWDQYSEANPEATHEDYLDARGDARESWKAEKTAKEQSVVAAARDAARRREALEQLDRDKFARIEEYRKDNPDYDVVMNTDEANALPFPPVMHLKMAESLIGPKIAHYLVLHPEEHIAIAELEEQLHRSELAPRAIGALIGTEIRKLELRLKGDAPVTSAAAPAAATPPAAPAATTPAAAPAASTTPRAAPSQPRTAAPAPVREIAGGAQPTRDSYALGNDGEDGDPYYLQRTQERKQMGLRG